MGVHIDHTLLNPDTLRNLIENFIAGESTNYGTREYSLDEKVAQVMRQLERGEAAITYDEKSDTCDLVKVVRSQN